MKKLILTGTLFLTGALLACLGPVAAAAQTEVRVLTYNIYWGGTSTEAPLEQTAEVIRQSEADIVAIQEKETWDERGKAFYRNSVQDLADMLDWDFANQRVEVAGTWDDVAILSRHPIKAVSEDQFCALIDASGEEIVLCNFHGYSAPYQPYQLLSIPYRDAPFITTETEAVEFANQARGRGLDALLDDLQAIGEGRPALVVGDFNEPSHLDWTQAAAEAGIHPLKVAFPQSRKLAEAGFVDAYRAIYPDEVAKPGFTWTPTTEEDAKDDHHDRIDFIYARGGEIIDAAILGEKPERADIVVTPWPSDHRAVVATIRFGKGD